MTENKKTFKVSKLVIIMVVLLRCKASPLEEDQLCETADPLWGLSPVHIFYHGIWHGQSHYSEKSRWPKTRPGRKDKRTHSQHSVTNA